MFDRAMLLRLKHSEYFQYSYSWLWISDGSWFGWPASIVDRAAGQNSLFFKQKFLTSILKRVIFIRIKLYRNAYRI